MTFEYRNQSFEKNMKKNVFQSDDMTTQSIFSIQEESIVEDEKNDFGFKKYI